MLKLFLRKILIKAIQPFGFYITYYASPYRVYSSLTKYPAIIQEYELRRIFDALGVANNHKFYNQLLASFLTDWKLEVKEAKFIGSGAGESSLSTFRKVNVEGKPLHEKIYFSSYQDIKRITWFYQHVSVLVGNAGINLPRVDKVFSGDVITAFYSDYVELIKLDTVKKEACLLTFSHQLYQLSLKEDFRVIAEKSPAYIKDFRSHFEYKQGIMKAKSILEKHAIDIELIEQYITKSRYVLTHGDIQDTNAFDRDTLIDWDSVGIYPAGFDAAFLFFILMLNNEKIKVDNFLEWIDTNFKNIVKEEEWDDFLLSFTFFLFVFIQRRMAGEKYDSLNNELKTELKKYI